MADVDGDSAVGAAVAADDDDDDKNEEDDNNDIYCYKNRYDESPFVNSS